jgi:hypothetical protein
MVIRKELGNGVSAVSVTKLIPDRYSRSNESIIAFQEVVMRDSFAVHTKTLQLAAWSLMEFTETPVLRKSC